MSKFTPNFNLEKPAKDEFYDVDVFNRNFDKLDQKAVKKGEGIAELTGGTLEARPAPGVVGRYYFAQDIGAIYLDIGTNWVLAAASQGDLVTVQQTVTSHMADYALHILSLNAVSLSGGTLQPGDAKAWIGQYRYIQQPASNPSVLTVASCELDKLRYFTYSFVARLRTNNIATTGIVKLIAKKWDGTTWQVIDSITLDGSHFPNTTDFHLASLGFIHAAGAVDNKIRLEVEAQAKANLKVDVDGFVIMPAVNAIYF